MSNEERVALDSIILEEPELAAAKYPYAQTLNALNALYEPDAERARASVFDTRAETVVAPPLAESSSESVTRAGALAGKAREAAVAHACASALAGHASESDDYMDVGLAIGKAPEANANSLLKALGLGDVLRGVEVSSIPLSRDTHLPTTFRASPDNPIVSALSGELGSLQHTFAFTAQRKGEPTVLYFLAGQTQAGEWIGLIGAGTSSD